MSTVIPRNLGTLRIRESMLGGNAAHRGLVGPNFSACIDLSAHSSDHISFSDFLVAITDLAVRLVSLSGWQPLSELRYGPGQVRAPRAVEAGGRGGKAGAWGIWSDVVPPECSESEFDAGTDWVAITGKRERTWGKRDERRDELGEQERGDEKAETRRLSSPHRGVDRGGGMGARLNLSEPEPEPERVSESESKRARVGSSNLAIVDIVIHRQARVTGITEKEKGDERKEGGFAPCLKSDGVWIVDTGRCTCIPARAAAWRRHGCLDVLPIVVPHKQLVDLAHRIRLAFADDAGSGLGVALPLRARVLGVPADEEGSGGDRDAGEAVNEEGQVGLRTSQEGDGEADEEAGAEVHCRRIVVVLRKPWLSRHFNYFNGLIRGDKIDKDKARTVQFNGAMRTRSVEFLSEFCARCVNLDGDQVAFAGEGCYKIFCVLHTINKIFATRAVNSPPRLPRRRIRVLSQFAKDKLLEDRDRYTVRRVSS
ncbi:hypothetical protein C8J57DRAFT_1469006 [Mycena rebaudengoi]|nr:hypothetical protein C8J57DRAFT_1469006 [Mycena rebaudengoi]